MLQLGGWRWGKQHSLHCVNNIRGTIGKFNLILIYMKHNTATQFQMLLFQWQLLNCKFPPKPPDSLLECVPDQVKEFSLLGFNRGRSSFYLLVFSGGRRSKALRKLSLWEARWLALRQPTWRSREKDASGFAAASRVSPRCERSSPRIVCSPFLSARRVPGKETLKSWQRFENVLSLLWAIQNPLKEMAIFHLMLSGSSGKLLCRWQSPSKQKRLWQVSLPLHLWPEAEHRGRARLLKAAKIGGVFPFGVRKPWFSHFTREKRQWHIFGIIFFFSLKWIYGNFKGCWLISDLV